MDLPVPASAAPSAALAEQDLCRALELEAPALLAMATRMLGDAADAADALQEAWLRAWTRRAALRDPAALRGWLRQIVARECLRSLRWRAVRRWIPFGEDLPERPLEQVPPELALDVARVRALVERLPPRQRQLWGLRFDEGWTIPEIAEATGLGAETVKTHLARALSTVRGSLEAPHV